MANACYYTFGDAHMNIYDRIRFLRESKGMSQQELAEKIGFKTASAVNKIELGLRDINQTKIIAFSKALGVTPAYLLDGDESEDKKNNIPSKTAEDEELMNLFSNLPSQKKQQAIDYLKFLLSQN